LGVLSISFEDWAAIFRETFWEYKTIVTKIPWHVWLSIVLAVGVNLLARKYPNSVNQPDERSVVPMLLPNKSIEPDEPVGILAEHTE
jgi:hypothetical protein